MRVELQKLKYLSEALSPEEFKSVVDWTIEYADTGVQPSKEQGIYYPFLLLKEEVDRDKATSKNRSKARTNATNVTNDTTVTIDAKGINVTKETSVTAEDNSLQNKELRQQKLDEWFEFCLPSEKKEEKEGALPSKESSKENITLSIPEKEQENIEPPIKRKQVKEKIPPMFLEFWEKYPKKVARQDAIKAWGQIKPTEATLALMLKAIEKQKSSHAWREAQYIPYPATWLRGRRWEDETVTESAGRFVGSMSYQDDISEGV